MAVDLAALAAALAVTASTQRSAAVDHFLSALNLFAASSEFTAAEAIITLRVTLEGVRLWCYQHAGVDAPAASGAKVSFADGRVPTRHHGLKPLDVCPDARSGRPIVAVLLSPWVAAAVSGGAAEPSSQYDWTPTRRMIREFVVPLMHGMTRRLLHSVPPSSRRETAPFGGVDALLNAAVTTANDVGPRTSVLVVDEKLRSVLWELLGAATECFMTLPRALLAICDDLQAPAARLLLVSHSSDRPPQDTSETYPIGCDPNATVREEEPSREWSFGFAQWLQIVVRDFDDRHVRLWTDDNGPRLELDTMRFCGDLAAPPAAEQIAGYDPALAEWLQYTSALHFSDAVIILALVLETAHHDDTKRHDDVITSAESGPCKKHFQRQVLCRLLALHQLCCSMHAESDAHRRLSRTTRATPGVTCSTSRTTAAVKWASAVWVKWFRFAFTCDGEDDHPLHASILVSDHRGEALWACLPLHSLRRLSWNAASFDISGRNSEVVILRALWNGVADLLFLDAARKAPDGDRRGVPRRRQGIDGVSNLVQFLVTHFAIMLSLALPCWFDVVSQLRGTLRRTTFASDAAVWKLGVAVMSNGMALTLLDGDVEELWTDLCGDGTLVAGNPGLTMELWLELVTVGTTESGPGSGVTCPLRRVRPSQLSAVHQLTLSMLRRYTAIAESRPTRVGPAESALVRCAGPFTSVLLSSSEPTRAVKWLLALADWCHTFARRITQDADGTTAGKDARASMFLDLGNGLVAIDKSLGHVMSAAPSGLVASLLGNFVSDKMITVIASAAAFIGSEGASGVATVKPSLMTILLDLTKRCLHLQQTVKCRCPEDFRRSIIQALLHVPDDVPSSQQEVSLPARTAMASHFVMLVGGDAELGSAAIVVHDDENFDRSVDNYSRDCSVRYTMARATST